LNVFWGDFRDRTGILMIKKQKRSVDKNRCSSKSIKKKYYVKEKTAGCSIAKETKLLVKESAQTCVFPRKDIVLLREKILPILRSNKVMRAAVFGSFARGDYTKKSDIDLLIDVPAELNILDIIGLKQELERKVGRKVDLVEFCAIRPIIREQVLKEQVRIL
jgi:uncharacterized protein